MTKMWRGAATATVMTLVTLGAGTWRSTAFADEQEGPLMIDGHPFSSNKDCASSDAISWHRHPIVRWACFDYDGGSDDPDTSQFAKSCADLNNSFGTKSLRCSIDHASFDKHYAEEAKIEKANARDDNGPGYYCASEMMGDFAGRAALADDATATIRQTTASKDEFLEKVSSITCVYSEKKAETVELVNKELKVYFNHKTSGGTWILAAMRRLKAFPKLEQNIKEYGVCKGGFGCRTHD